MVIVDFLAISTSVVVETIGVDRAREGVEEEHSFYLRVSEKPVQRACACVRGSLS